MLDNRKKLQLALAKRGYMNEDLVNEIEQIYNKQQLPIHGVINWVAVDKQEPPTIDLLYLTYNGDEMIFRYWNSNYFEGEHIASEPKVTHWAIVKTPCL